MRRSMATMVTRMMAFAFAVLAGLAASAMAAPAADPACPGGATLPAELAGWSARQAAPIRAGRDEGTAGALILGSKAMVSLADTAQVRFAVPPAKVAPTPAHGGLLAFTTPVAGLYRVALAAGAWVDVVRDGKAIDSVAHGHGPACSGIRKMVDFRLEAGRYLLQLSGSADPRPGLMVSRLP